MSAELMGYGDCIAYFTKDTRRLPALNTIRARKNSPAYSIEEAASIMSCFGGCDRETFDGIDTAIRAELEQDGGTAGAAGETQP